MISTKGLSSLYATVCCCLSSTSTVAQKKKISSKKRFQNGWTTDYKENSMCVHGMKLWKFSTKSCDVASDKSPIGARFFGLFSFFQNFSMSLSRSLDAFFCLRKNFSLTPTTMVVPSIRLLSPYLDIRHSQKRKTYQN